MMFINRGLLTRYLAIKFIGSITAVFVLCSLLIFLIDFVELMRQAGKYGDVSMGLLLWLTVLRLPAYTEFLLAFAVLVGSISALVFLARKSELAVMRAGGMSAWQFIAPGLVIAFVFGVLAVTLYNPMAAKARDYSEDLRAKAFGRDANLLESTGGLTWLRQDGADGPSVISAAHARNKGLGLIAVTVYLFGENGGFLSRIDARTADLNEGYWRLKDVTVSQAGTQPVRFDEYILATYLSPERVQDAFGTVISLSFWDLPGLIDIASKAGLNTDKLKIQYELLLSRPFLCMAMVLLAATVSLRSFRGGGIQTMIGIGLAGGLGFFLFAEVSRQIG
ncbi:MAG: LPS export ABC transporter permease LptG, partial [Pseudomonadota bacterium]